jgi:hypothetical protein
MKGRSDRIRTALIFLSTALLPVLAVAGPPQQPKDAPDAQRSAPAVQLALPPPSLDTAATPEALLERLLSRESDDLTVVRRPDGTELIHMADRFAMVAVVRRNADGSLSYGCIDDFAKWKAFMYAECPAIDPRPVAAVLPEK